MFNSFDSFDNKPSASSITMNQGLQVMRSMSKIDQEKISRIENIRNDIIYKGRALTREASSLAQVNHSMLSEVRHATKVNPFSSIESQEKDTDQFKEVISGKHFIRVAYEVIKSFSESYANLVFICSDIIPSETFVSEKVSNVDSTKTTTDDLRDKIFEYQLNEGAIKKYVSGLLRLEAANEFLEQDLNNLVTTIENYYKYLSDRHNNIGIKVHKDALITDISYAIFQNVDAHGEITASVDEDKISAYTLNKGLLVVEAAYNPIVSQLISQPDMLVKYVKDGFNTLATFVSEIRNVVESELDEVLSYIGVRSNMRVPVEEQQNQLAIQYNRLMDANPSSIINKSDEKFVSQDEKFARQYEEETIENIVDKLSTKTPPGDVLKYIISRKKDLKKHFQEENTFYVCQISQGNPFLGEAPGALKVIPGQKPNIKMDHIVGSGFGEVREFYKSVEAGAKWQPLFIATSPSKTADKSNCLMVGPPGCGKTELMRAIGADKDCIGIFAQGSDFLTCWKGEAEKNPKRLFEQALKLHKESKKRVYILIDEIDAVMHKPEGHNDINLTLEFQILMDGVVSYPGISIWGATNNPERLPMAMIRRFNKVEIVGELNSENRISLLKHFLNNLPQKDFKDESWEKAAEKLEGATGDVIRQVCDHIWRKKMHAFVSKDKDGAVKAMDFLVENEGGFDVSSFDEKKSHNFKNVLQKYVNVTPSDVNDSIKAHLRNMAVQSEIETAVNTYKSARQFLLSLDSQIDG